MAVQPAGAGHRVGDFSAVNLVAIFWFANWETIPFHFIWISLTLLYGFRPGGRGPTVWVLAAVMLTTASGIGLDVYRGSEPAQELTEVPLMAAVFVAMAWSAHRKQAAEWSHHEISEQNARLLADQRRFLQDAAHQLQDPHHHRPRPRRTARGRTRPQRRPAGGRGHRGRHRRAQPAAADLRAAAPHRRRRRPRVPAPRAGRARPADQRADPPLAARRRPALADRAA